ncbi:MAG: hypothetical protein Q9163_005606 [Psora crenata]
MAANPTQSQKSSSRWGAFLAGVESRLDTILTEEDPRSQTKQNGKVSQQPGKEEGMAVPATGAARAPSTNRAQDRLNEKLARAMANKNLNRRGDVSVTSSAVPSRTESPANVLGSSRDSMEVAREKVNSRTNVDGSIKSLEKQEVNNIGQAEDKGDTASAIDDEVRTSDKPGGQVVPLTNGGKEDALGPRLSTDSPGTLSTRQSVELTRATTPNGPDSPKLNSGETETVAVAKMPEEYEITVQQLRSENEAAELRRQEEMHDYLERIDALQAKLQYLTREAVEIARTASSEVNHGSPEQRLAAKDEKIALLIDEGQKLSQTELKHMTLIKKLRAKSAEDEKAAADAKRRAEHHEKSAREAQERAIRAETAQRRAVEKVKGLARLEEEMDRIKADRDAKDVLIRDLQIQLSDITSNVAKAEEKAHVEALELGRRRAADLADELSTVRMEKELAEKEHQNVLRELREKWEREKERARIADIERQGELNILESRLETYRARAEEASAGQGGGVQAKLLRQIETLQNQYAVASENWQGIEGSLLSRVTALEKERDETAKREADIRRKAREMVRCGTTIFGRLKDSTNTRQNAKYKRMEEELERTTSETQELDHQRSTLASQINTLQDRLNKAEAEVVSARNDLKAERESWESRYAQRLEEERNRLKEELLRSHPENIYTQFRAESPIMQIRTCKSCNPADRCSPHSRRFPAMQGLAITGTGHSSLERPLSRHSSNQRIMSGCSDMQPHPPSRGYDGQDSPSMSFRASVHNGIPQTPSIIDDAKQGDEDFFAGVHTPATPPERSINDIFSVSTAGAGPSVQLVERMSAAVRRLESEKAAHKDELVRLGQQRDEAREQVVELMRDNEGKKALDDRLKKAERELEELKERYETTLEMLGEKSEKVEELKQDVLDLKGLLREMVEERVK